MTAQCLRNNASRFNKDKSILNLIAVEDLRVVDDIIEPEVNQGKQIQAEEVNEEVRSKYKETRTVQEQGDNFE